MIREVDPSDFTDQIGALTAANWAETGLDFELDINWELYAALHAAGHVICLVAFDHDGEPIGYSTAFIGPHVFSRTIVTCESNALFVRSDHRVGVLPGRLIIETERVAKERGATHMSWNTRAGTALAATLARRGYTVADQVVMREL